MKSTTEKILTQLLLPDYKQAMKSIGPKGIVIALSRWATFLSFAVFRGGFTAPNCSRDLASGSIRVQYSGLYNSPILSKEL
eukprot:846449-Amphidinium_carterae.1